MSQLLSDEDIAKVTKKAKPSAQKKALVAMRIPFIERTDGTVLLTWPAINHCLIGTDKISGDLNLSALDILD